MTTIATGKYLLLLLYACHTLLIGSAVSVGSAALEVSELDMVVVSITVLGASDVLWLEVELELGEEVEVGTLELVSSVLELEESVDDDDGELEEEEDLVLLLLLELVISVSDTGMLTEVDVGAPGLAPFETSILLVRAAVAAAALTALDRSASSSSSDDVEEDEEVLDCLTGRTTTAGALSSSKSS